ncbi:LOW QUALITY PROTEIN: methionine aminopeptidase-like [Sycon ciliatum]|uniref:LOW QUALITY PROTEIN: methionine aminopeptidase-like n=1 Tax=Sycon ciliatum TaxID=27933 RepID=UPI0031F6DE42
MGVQQRISIKSERKIDQIRRSCGILANLMNEAVSKVVPGAIPRDVDRFCHDWITKAGGRPSFLNWHGYPYATCISVNHCIIHGMPDDRLLSRGDIVGLDIGIEYDGAYSDHAVTVPVGEVSVAAQQVLDVTEQSLQEVIKQLVPGMRVSDVGRIVEDVVRPYSYGIIRDYCGHGVGDSVWEPPQIPNYRTRSPGPRFRENMVIAVEPMLSIGSPDVIVGANGWNVETKDKTLGSHVEHTMLITKHGMEVLTRS